MGGVQTKQNSFLTSSLGGGEWSASRPDRFTPGKELRYPLNRWLAEPQSQSGHFAAQTELVCARIRNPNGLARSVVIVDCDYATSAASRSHFQGSSSRGVKVSRSRMSGVTVPLPPIWTGPSLPLMQHTSIPNIQCHCLVRTSTHREPYHLFQGPQTRDTPTDCIQDIECGPEGKKGLLSVDGDVQHTSAERDKLLCSIVTIYLNSAIKSAKYSYCRVACSSCTLQRTAARRNFHAVPI